MTAQRIYLLTIFHLFARKMIKEILSFFRKKIAKKEIAQYDLIETLPGWYRFDNPLQMPSERQRAIQLAEIGLGWNMSKETLLTCIDSFIESNNKKDASELGYKLYAFKEKVNLIINSEVLLNLVCLLYLLPDEPIDKVQTFWIEKKKEMIKKDDSLRQYFFLELMQTYKKMENDVAEDLIKYLTEADKITSQLNRILKV